ncbi:MAG: hypothetical protein F6K26_24205 [Moorea sp. SIO2I5]|nr:hypothetical protein [Moorena sp. SIO2I5]
MGFPNNFLTDIAKDKKLTEGEKKVFLLLFGNDKSRVQIAETLYISESAVSSRITGIYRKFQITDSGPVKENRLKDYLSKKYQPWQSENSEDSSILDSEQQSIDELALLNYEMVSPERGILLYFK